MAKHNDLGKVGEEKAIAHLISLGHVLLAANYRVGHDEVDIITSHGNFIVFTEVKTRSGNYYGYPEEFVDRKKRMAMKRVAEVYMSEHHSDADVRFDIISIHNYNGELKVYHIPDAFFNEDSGKYN